MLTDKNTLRNMAARFSLVLAPLCLLLGWIVLMLRAGQGPDAGWFVSHALLLIGAVLFVPAVLGLGSWRANNGSLTLDIGAGLVLVGSAALVGQFAMDLAVGSLASDQAEMSAYMRQIASTPGIALPFHLVGPIAFYGGLLVVTTHLWRMKLISRGIGLLVTISIILVGAQAVTGNALLALIGFAGMTAGFAVMAWQPIRPHKSTGSK